MAQIKTDRFDFPSATGEIAPQSKPVELGGRIRDAVAVLTGYQIGFSKKGGDHELGQALVTVHADVLDASIGLVKVTGTYTLRDWSGEFDDPYEGSIEFAVLPIV